MDTTDAARAGDPGSQARRDVVARLRREVVTGVYEPPAEVLAERIVQVVMARRQASARPQR